MDTKVQQTLLLLLMEYILPNGKLVAAPAISDVWHPYMGLNQNNVVQLANYSDITYIQNQVFKRYSAVWSANWTTTGKTGYSLNSGIPLLHWNVKHENVICYLVNVTVNLNISITCPSGGSSVRTFWVMYDQSEYSSSWIRLDKGETVTYTSTLTSSTYLIFPYGNVAFVCVDAFNIGGYSQNFTRDINTYWYLHFGFDVDCTINSNNSTVNLQSVALLA